jgi:DNA-binding protein
MDNMGFKIGSVKIASQIIESDDGKQRNVSNY